MEDTDVTHINGWRVPVKPIIRRIEPISETAASLGIWRGKKVLLEFRTFFFYGVPPRLLCGEPLKVPRST